MTNWTIKHVAERFDEAARSAERLPPIHLQDYAKSWPIIVRQSWENYATERVVRHYSPSPEAIDRMLEAMHWVTWLEEEQRHLVWMRAERYGWRDITIRFACDRSTAWRRWQKALETVTAKLNASLA